jgi:hypothetical protein
MNPSTYFSPMLNEDVDNITTQRGELRTYTLNFNRLYNWKTFVTYIRNKGYKIYGRRVKNRNDTDESDDNERLFLTVVSDYPDIYLLQRRIEFGQDLKCT